MRCSVMFISCKELPVETLGGSEWGIPRHPMLQKESVTYLVLATKAIGALASRYKIRALAFSCQAEIRDL